MARLYFPGANTGRGFVSRFGGIIPSWANPHYTYVLKGGPGVGKNTLMRTVAKRAAAKGMAVEEFRCASDPDSFDAVRIPALRVMLLDGTAPHSIDPVLPGIEEEILDLGRFKNRTEFASRRDELRTLFAENKAHYHAAYAMLGAACALQKEAIGATAAAVDTAKLHAWLREHFVDAEKGTPRALFARSATPKGVIDYASTYLPADVTVLAGPVGAVALAAAAKLLGESRAEIGYDFLDPDQPRTVTAGHATLTIGDGGDTLDTFCASPIPSHVAFCMEQAEALTDAATKELAKSLAAHDAIEEIYRPYVDYDHVNTESEKLLRTLGL